MAFIARVQFSIGAAQIKGSCKNAGIQMITVAVCIPTYNRPAQLREAVNSCLCQTRLPDEICIEDNSSDDASEQVVMEFKQSTNVSFVYTHTRQRLPQAENFNNLIKRVSSTHFVLLHDDDLLLPDAIQDLSGCWDIFPELTGAYGKQYVFSDAGGVDFAQSERLNVMYRRTADHEGLQEKSWFPGLVQQFPNDGWLVRTAAASDIMWRPSQGDGCEFDFGLRLCLKYQGFCFVNRHTMKYRVNSTSMSVSSSHDATLRSFWILRDASLPTDAEDFRRKQLKEFAPQAVTQAVRKGLWREALRIYFSESYPWRRRLTGDSVWNLGELVVPRRLSDYVRRGLRKRQTEGNG
jgi:glycosyltransferase involved in cell wall biosynthesis